MTAASAARRFAGWWFEPAPQGRVAAFRVLVYLFIPLDVFVFTPWVADHAELPTTLYQPLVVGDLLHLPTPTHAFVVILKWLLVAVALAAATGRAPRLLGGLAFVLYFEWMIVAMSYGKVDHDRFAFLVALAVLPTVVPRRCVGGACGAEAPTRTGAQAEPAEPKRPIGTVRARLRDRTPSESAGWALRCVQVAVVMTYFLSAWAKIRFGGWDWPTGATLARSILRRGTVFSDWLLDHPDMLVAGQFLMIGGELLSPLLLLARTDRARIRVAVGLVAFHIAVFAGITIIFMPHVIAIAAFLPLERIPRPARLARRAEPVPSSAVP